MKNKWFLEVVQDFDGSYYANMTIDGKSVQGLPEHVDYNTLRMAIREKTGIKILKRKDLFFQQSGRKKYAYIDATQDRGEGKDCRVTLEEMKGGHKPDFFFENAIEELKSLLDENPPENANYWLEESRVNVFGWIEDNGDDYRWIILQLEMYDDNDDLVKSEEFATEDVNEEDLSEQLESLIKFYKENWKKENVYALNS